MFSWRDALAVTLCAVAAFGCKSDDSTGPPSRTADLDSLTVSLTSAPADGRSITVVRAVMPLTSRALPRQVIFTTTAGSFLPQGSAAASTIVVPVDRNGGAVALLQSPTAEMSASVTARAGETTLQQTVDFVRPLPDLSALRPSADSVVADDVSTIAFTATLRRASTLSPRMVTFETTGGAFVPSGTTMVTVQTDTADAATALLRAPADPGSAIVRAKAGISTLQVGLRFVRAYPEGVVLTSDSFTVAGSSNKSLKIQANLVRATGRVSRGGYVTFTATDSTGTTIGWFSGALEITPGVFQVQFTPGDTAYLGPVVITASTAGANGVIQSSLRVQVTKP